MIVTGAAKQMADERVATAESEWAWQRQSIERQLDEARAAAEAAGVAERAEAAAVLAMRAMLHVADADVAAMRGAAAHYATLGGEEAGALREALANSEGRRREAVETERRRVERLLDDERSHFEGVLHRLRESSFAVQAKLSSQVEWLNDALAEKGRLLVSEREGFEAALGREREATAAAHGEARRLLEEVAERQAARHATELVEAGGAMETQLMVEREALIAQVPPLPCAALARTRAHAHARARARARTRAHARAPTPTHASPDLASPLLSARRHEGAAGHAGRRARTGPRRAARAARRGRGARG